MSKSSVCGGHKKVIWNSHSAHKGHRARWMFVVAGCLGVHWGLAQVCCHPLTIFLLSSVFWRSLLLFPFPKSFLRKPTALDPDRGTCFHDFSRADSWHPRDKTENISSKNIKQVDTYFYYWMHTTFQIDLIKVARSRWPRKTPPKKNNGRVPAGGRHSLFPEEFSLSQMIQVVRKKCSSGATLELKNSL